MSSSEIAPSRASEDNPLMRSVITFDGSSDHGRSTMGLRKGSKNHHLIEEEKDIGRSGKRKIFDIEDLGETEGTQVMLDIPMRRGKEKKCGPQEKPKIYDIEDIGETKGTQAIFDKPRRTKKEKKNVPLGKKNIYDIEDIG